MQCRFLAGLGITGLILVQFAACGGGSSSPSSPTPTQTSGTLTIKGSTTAAGVFALQPPGHDAPVGVPGTPTSVKVMVYKVYLAAGADCSSPITAQDKGGAAGYQEMTGRPTLFSASVTAGTYNCLILKVRDVMKFTPDGAAQSGSNGVCLAGQERDFDILKSENPAESWYNVETGGSTGGAGSYGSPSAQDVFLFFSTNGASTTAANGRVHPHQLTSLANPVVIRASEVTNGAFVFDFAGRLAVVSESVNGPHYCWLEGVRTQYVGQ